MTKGGGVGCYDLPFSNSSSLSQFLSSVFSSMKISIFKFLFSLNGARVFLGDGPLEKLLGEGNFRAAGIFFRYQTPCMNFFKATA